MKVRDYLRAKKDPKLEGLKVRTSKSVVGYIFSIGNCIVFLNSVSGPITKEGRLYPQMLLKNSDIEKWDIVGEDIKCNCDHLTTHKYVIND